jgi:hypothetical protein
MSIDEECIRAIVRLSDRRETYRDAGRPTAEDADRILGIAAMMIRADGEEYAEERHAFRIFADEVRSITGAKDVAALDDHPFDRDDEARLAHVRILAKELSCPAAGALAYKIAVALRDCDQAVVDSEYDLEDVLATALGLTVEETDALTAEVHDALAGPEIA